MTLKRTQDQAPARLEGQHSLSFIECLLCDKHDTRSFACVTISSSQEFSVRLILQLGKMRPRAVPQLLASRTGVTGECRSMIIRASSVEGRCLPLAKKDGSRSLGRCLVPKR